MYAKHIHTYYICMYAYPFKYVSLICIFMCVRACLFRCNCLKFPNESLCILALVGGVRNNFFVLFFVYVCCFLLLFVRFCNFNFYVFFFNLNISLTVKKN